MKYIYLLSIMAAVCLTACSKEDDITPHDSEENVFLNTYGSSASDIALQNAFFEKNGIYVLFNDTLRKTQIGLDADGKPYYDVKSVDIGYGMNSSINSYTEKINFSYLTSDVDKKEGVNFVNEMILPSLGKALRPFSFLLVNKINYYVNSYGTLRLSNPVVYSGWRCTAFCTTRCRFHDGCQEEGHKKHHLANYRSECNQFARPKFCLPSSTRTVINIIALMLCTTKQKLLSHYILLCMTWAS
jgi:hypothetical protein